jgi:hypothetical protein
MDYINIISLCFIIFLIYYIRIYSFSEKFENSNGNLYYLVFNFQQKYYLTIQNNKLILTTDKINATKFSLDKDNNIIIDLNYLKVNISSDNINYNINPDTDSDSDTDSDTDSDSDSTDIKYYNIVAKDKKFYPPSNPNGVIGKILYINDLVKYLSIKSPTELIWTNGEGPSTLYLEIEKI